MNLLAAPFSFLFSLLMLALGGVTLFESQGSCLGACLVDTPEHAGVIAGISLLSAAFAVATCIKAARMGIPAPGTVWSSAQRSPASGNKQDDARRQSNRAAPQRDSVQPRPVAYEGMPRASNHGLRNNQ